MLPLALQFVIYFLIAPPFAKQQLLIQTDSTHYCTQTKQHANWPTRCLATKHGSI